MSNDLDAYDQAMTASDAAQAALDARRARRWKIAQDIYEQRILPKAQPGTRRALDLNAPVIIETIAGLLPLQQDIEP